jgi:hypothetical protein
MLCQTNEKQAFSSTHLKAQARSAGDSQFTMRPGDPHHDLWLAMQTAHNNYIRASEEMDAAHSEITPARTLAMIASEQRKAFERYIEARMQFSECSRDQARTAEPGAVPDRNISFYGRC